MSYIEDGDPMTLDRPPRFSANCRLPPRLHECAMVVSVVSQATNVREADFFAPSRLGLPAANARQLAMYLCHVLLEMTMTDVGCAFGRDRTTVAHACAQIEDSRDDEVVNARIQRLEDKIMARRRTARPTTGVGPLEGIHNARA